MPGSTPATPTRLAHLDHGNDRAILVQGDEGPAQVVRLGHRGTPSVTRSDEIAISISAKSRLALRTKSFDPFAEILRASPESHRFLAKVPRSAPSSTQSPPRKPGPRS